MQVIADAGLGGALRGAWIVSLINGVTGRHLAFLSLVSLRRAEPVRVRRLGSGVWPLLASTAHGASGVWPYDQEGDSHC